MRELIPDDMPPHYCTVSVVIGLGTNLGDRATYLRDAVDRLRALLTNVQRSSVYETPPFGILDQPRFLNMVVIGTTARTPHALVVAMQRIEHTMGRQVRERNGPREIDLDLLLYGSCAFSTPTLTVPHPGLHERASVLLPIATLAPHLRHPVLGKTVAALLTQVDVTGCAPWPIEW